MTNFKKCAKIFIESILRRNSSFIAAETIVFSPLFPLAIFREGKLFCPARFPFGRNGFLIARFPSRSMPAPLFERMLRRAVFPPCPLRAEQSPRAKGALFSRERQTAMLFPLTRRKQSGAPLRCFPRGARARAFFAPVPPSKERGRRAMLRRPRSLLFLFFRLRSRAPCAKPAPRPLRQPRTAPCAA